MASPVAVKQAEVTGADIVAQARRVLGKPYVYGAQGPNAFDCSGLVKWCCDNVGLSSCPRTSEAQFGWVQRIDTPGEGDLIFFVGAEEDPPPGHVGIVVAPGQMIDAPFTGSYVQQTGYGLNGVGVNRVMGFGRIPKVQGSPTGTGNLDQESLQNNAVGMVVGYIAAIAVVAFVVIAVIIALIFVYKGGFGHAV